MTTTETAKINVLDQLIADRKELLALCKNLTQDEWNAPSLCEGWRVRDVVAHIIGGQKDILGYFTAGMKANEKQVERRHNISTAELLRQLEEITNGQSFLLKIASGIFLYDDWIHQEDIRWPLHKERKQDPARVRFVLDTLAKRAAKKITERNQKLVATDMDWQLGEGQEEIRGTAEALVMFLAGRRKAALEKLNGPGADKLKTGN
jgi:uncharacterized protein (TIGR03083 family)